MEVTINNNIYQQAVNLTMNENLELGVLVYNLDADAQHPSYAPKF